MAEPAVGVPIGLEQVPDLLRTRRVLVTGAASGIGAAVTLAFRQAGATVVGADLREAQGITRCDVRSESDVLELFDGPARDVTDVVHAAGIADDLPIEDVSLQLWEDIIDTNLTGSFLIGREVARRFAAPGSLTFLASVAGLYGSDRYTAYCASKFGVVGLTRSFGHELAPRRIRVNAVCPSGVHTPMSDRSIAGDARRLQQAEATLRAKYDAEVPIGRFAEPDEVAGVCVFLASPLAAHVTGATLQVDGAQYA
jgi:NAD(P)-dependent dehydrogenase (short-subunit alcohol dehydrogenase family)